VFEREGGVRGGAGVGFLVCFFFFFLVFFFFFFG